MQPTYTLQALPNGEAGTRETLNLMGGLVRKYKTAKAIRELALVISLNVPAKNWPREAAAVQTWVRANIRYTKDVSGVETLQSPIQTLRLRQGDCDDHSTLTAALLEAIGHPTRFIAVGFSAGRFNHVLTQTKIGPNWLAVETTENYRLGEMPPNIKNRMYHHN